ncbi:MAG: 50S ribosomal protein L31e [Promethearchaeota archaeon]
MAKKKVISKKKPVSKEAPIEIKKEESPDDIDAFDLEKVPDDEEEVSDLEQEMTEEEEFEEEIQEERFYVVPLAKKGFERAARWKASKKAVKVLQEFLVRHMKPEGTPYISQDLNERIWERGIKHPPRKIRIRVTKSTDGVVRAYLA